MQILKLLNAKNVFMPHIQEKVNPQLAYKFMKFIQSIEPEEIFYQKKMSEIIAEFIEKNSDGKPVIENNLYKPIEGKEEECSKAVIDLQSVEITPPDIKFTFDELSEIKLSIVDMSAIEDFIKIS